MRRRSFANGWPSLDRRADRLFVLAQRLKLAKVSLYVQIRQKTLLAVDSGDILHVQEENALASLAIKGVEVS